MDPKYIKNKNHIHGFMDSTGVGLLSFTIHGLISERMKGIERYEINSKIKPPSG